MAVGERGDGSRPPARDREQRILFGLRVLAIVVLLVLFTVTVLAAVDGRPISDVLIALLLGGLGTFLGFESLGLLVGLK